MLQNWGKKDVELRRCSTRGYQHGVRFFPSVQLIPTKDFILYFIKFCYCPPTIMKFCRGGLELWRGVIIPVCMLSFMLSDIDYYYS